MGEFKETEVRREHRYYLLLDELGIDHDALDGAGIDESKRAVSLAIERMIAQRERSESDRATQGPITVKIGGEEYEVAPRVWGETLAWRRRMGRVIKQVIQSARGGGDLIEVAQGSDPKINLSALLESFAPYLLGEGSDELIELMFDYSPELRERREQIMACPNPEQIIDAAGKVFNLAYPLALAVARLALGLATRQAVTGI